MQGSWFKGRPLAWDGDAQVIEQERQRWVYEKIHAQNELIRELSVDPDQEYAAHRQEWEETGDLAQLRLMLEYVRP